MKIGLISDIHGNFQAFQQVLSSLEALEVNLVLCAGDLVCYGANPNEVLTLVRQQGISCVTGNYDAAVAWNWSRSSRKPSSPRNERLKQAALDWTKQHLAWNHLGFLQGLPWTSVHKFGDLSLRLLHAGPFFLDEWVSPDEPQTFSVVAELMPADVIVLGHTHQPFVEEHNGILFVNPGAVGRSLDGDPRLSYAVLETETLAVKHYRETYDLEAALTAIHLSSMPAGIGTLIQHAARRIEQLSPE